MYTRYTLGLCNVVFRLTAICTDRCTDKHDSLPVVCIGAFLTHLSPGVGSGCMCQQVVESIYSAVPVGKHDSHLRNITQLEEKCLFQRMGSKDYSCKRLFFLGCTCAVWSWVLCPWVCWNWCCSARQGVVEWVYGAFLCSIYYRSFQTPFRHILCTNTIYLLQYFRVPDYLSIECMYWLV